MPLAPSPPDSVAAVSAASAFRAASIDQRSSSARWAAASSARSRAMASALRLQRGEGRARPLPALLLLALGEQFGVLLLGGGVRRVAVASSAVAVSTMCRARSAPCCTRPSRVARSSLPPPARRLATCRPRGARRPRRQRLRLLEVGDEGLVLEGIASLGVLAALLERALVLLEAPRAEQGAQQRLALVVLCEQEAREPVLSEQDHLQELLLVQPQDLVEQHADVPRAGRAALHAPSTHSNMRASVRLGRRAAAAALEPVELGRALDAPSAAAGGELEHDLGGVARLAVVAAQALLALFVARHVAVEREADGVEDAGLARSRAPGDEEDALVGEGVEVDGLPVTERTEALDLEAVDPHASTSDDPALRDDIGDERRLWLARALTRAHVGEERVDQLGVGSAPPACAPRTTPRRRPGAPCGSGWIVAHHGKRVLQPAHRLELRGRVGELRADPASRGARRAESSVSSSSSVPRRVCSRRGTGSPTHSTCDSPAASR